MFDYGLTPNDIWNFVYFNLFVTFSFFYLSFSHLESDQIVSCLIYVFVVLFFAVFYNLEPLRLKTKPFGPEASVVIANSMCVVLSYFLITKEFSFISFCLNQAPCLLLVEWATTINLYMDTEDDKRDNSSSIPILIGDSLSKLNYEISVYILTIRYAINNNNIYACIPLLSVPLHIKVTQLGFKKQKIAKLGYFLTMPVFNFLFAIGVLLK